MAGNVDFALHAIVREKWKISVPFFEPVNKNVFLGRIPIGYTY